MKNLILMFLLSAAIYGHQAAAQNITPREFSLIVNVEDKEKYFEEHIRANPAVKKNPEEYDQYLTVLAISWLAKGNIEKFRYYTKSDPEFSFIPLYDLIDVLQKLEKEDKYLSVIEEVTRGVIRKTEKAAAKDEMVRGRFQVLLEINAMANARLGNVTAAVKNMAKASSIKGDRDLKYFKDSRANYLNRYAIVLSAAGEHKRALDTLTKAVREADSNPMLIATLRTIYKKVHGDEKDADQFIASLQKEAYEKYYREVEKSFIADVNIPVTGITKSTDNNTIQAFKGNRPAGQVSLQDINGKTIHFADYKGKILVIDFWTTGCTPCVSAFAGFEHVVAEYKNDPFQLFIVNLFEDEARVKNFIAEKGITLDVLRDEENKAYDVQATPTKIIFDPMGNIRFYAVGYAGSTDREYYKLKAMVEIVKRRTSDKAVAMEK